MFAVQHFVSSVYDNVTSWAGVKKAETEEDTSSGTNVDEKVDFSSSQSEHLSETRDGSSDAICELNEHSTIKESSTVEDGRDSFNIDYDSGYDDSKTSGSVYNTVTDTERLLPLTKSDQQDQIGKLQSQHELLHTIHVKNGSKFDEYATPLNNVEAYRCVPYLIEPNKSIAAPNIKPVPNDTFEEEVYSIDKDFRNSNKPLISTPANIPNENTFSFALESSIDDVINTDDVIINEVSDKGDDISCEEVFSLNGYDSQSSSKASVTNNAEDKRLDNCQAYESELTGCLAAYRDEQRAGWDINGCDISAEAPEQRIDVCEEWDTDPPALLNTHPCLIGKETETYSCNTKPFAHSRGEESSHDLNCEKEENSSKSCSYQSPESDGISCMLSISRAHPSCIADDIFAASNDGRKLLEASIDSTVKTGSESDTIDTSRQNSVMSGTVSEDTPSTHSMAQSDRSSLSPTSNQLSPLAAAKSLDSEFARLTSTIEKKYKTKMESTKTVKSKDKFVVSFNSDTSDSDESDTFVLNKNRVLDKSTDDKVPNGINDASVTEEKSSKSKKKKSEKKEGDKTEKKSKKTDKHSESKVDSEDAKVEKKSKSDKTDKKDKKSDKKEKKSEKSDKSDKSSKSDKDKSEKKEKKEKKSKTKESKKKEIDSDTSASCSINGDIDVSNVQNGSPEKAIETNNKIKEGSQDISETISLPNGHSAITKQCSTTLNQTQCDDVIETTMSFTVLSDDVSITKSVESSNITVADEVTFNVTSNSEHVTVKDTMHATDGDSEIIHGVQDSTKSDQLFSTEIECEGEDEKIRGTTEVFGTEQNKEKENGQEGISLALSSEDKTSNGDSSNGERSVQSFTLNMVEDKSYHIAESSASKTDQDILNFLNENTEKDTIDNNHETEVNDSSDDISLQTKVIDTSKSPDPLPDENITIDHVVGDNRETGSTESEPRLEMSNDMGGCVKDNTEMTGQGNNTSAMIVNTEVEKTHEQEEKHHDCQHISAENQDSQTAQKHKSSLCAEQDIWTCLPAAAVSGEKGSEEQGASGGYSNSNSTDPTSVLLLTDSGQALSPTITTQQETCAEASSEKLYSSQNIKSIYFSEEFEQAEVFETAGAKGNDGNSAMDDSPHQDVSLNKQVQRETQNISSASEKYQQILTEVTANTQNIENTTLTQSTSGANSSESPSERKSFKSFSQDSYEAAVSRAFSAKPREERNASDRRHSSSRENNPAAADQLFPAPPALEPAAKTQPAASDVFATSNRATDLRMSSHEDGKDSFERTTTFLAGDRQSTDELIKRILAESRGEIPARQTRSDNISRISADDDINASASISNAQYERCVLGSSNAVTSASRSRYERSMLNEECDTMNLARNHEAMETDDSSGSRVVDNRPLSDNRALSDNKIPEAAARRGMYTDEDYENMQMRSSKSPFSNYSDQGESSEEHRRRYRSGFMQKQAAIYDDYAASFQSAANRYAQDEDSDDDDRYPGRRRQAMEEVDFIPDEEFIPKKAEDTDEVVQERTAEIRNVVDNQNQVLTRLKSASDSFDELQDEIKQIKQQFLETSMRRSVIMDDLDYEREQWEYDMAQASGYNNAAGGYIPGSGAGGGQGRRQYGGYQRRSARSRGVTDEDFDYEQSATNYRPYSTRQAAELDKDLESDRIGSGALQNLAIASSMSGLMSRDDLDTEQRYGSGRSYSGYTSSTARRGRSASMFEDNDLGLDLSNVGRPKTVSRFATNGMDNDDDDDDDAESYTSPNLPSYRKYDSYSSDHGERSYSARSGAKDYTSAYTSRYGSDNRYDDVASSTSGDSGSARYGHRTLGRSQTLDSYNYSSSSRTKYSSPATSSFSSRFLSKVREKKAAGEDIKRDKPFSSRFLSSKTTFDGPYSSTTSYAAKSRDSTFAGRDSQSQEGSDKRDLGSSET